MKHLVKQHLSPWVKKYLLSFIFYPPPISSFKVIKASHPKLLILLETCIRNGYELLIEDIGETLDPVLEPVLQKAHFVNQGRRQIHLGDSDVDYDLNFRVSFTTKLANPHYLPEIAIKVLLINFTGTGGDPYIFTGKAHPPLWIPGHTPLSHPHMSSQRPRQRESIFRLLLKVAVTGAQKCAFRIFSSAVVAMRGRSEKRHPRVPILPLLKGESSRCGRGFTRAVT